MKSSTYFEFASVVEVTPEGVVVQAPGKGLLLFDSDGKHCRDKFECLPLFDIKTLAVGQEVWMRSGVYSTDGRVVRVTSERIDVQTGMMQKDGWHARDLLHFDNNGRSYVTEGRRTHTVARRTP